MNSADNAGRERILGRIRAALQTTAGGHERTMDVSEIFPPVTDVLGRFQAECAANLTECVVTHDTGESAAAIRHVLASLPAGEIFVQDAPELRQLASAGGEGRAVKWSSEGKPGEASQATITLCEALVALTGSILVSAACGGRGASVVAPCHIVFARASQLVPDLEAALARARERGIDARNSFMGLVTGSSRTADIEKILVQGAHGPRRVVVVLQSGL